MEIKVVDKLEELQEYAEAWDTLVQQSSHCLPMQSHAWLSCYFRHRMEPGEQWQCWLLFDAQQLIGVLPLVSLNRMSMLGKRKLLRLPEDEQTTISVDIVSAPGREQEVFKYLAGYLQQQHGGWRELNMPRVPENSATIAALPELRGSLHCLCEQRSLGSYLPTDSDFANYRAGLSPNLRSNLRKAANRLAHIDEFEYECLTGEHASPKHLARFLEVESASWKGDTGTTIVANADHNAFYHSLIQALWQRGWLEWHFLTIKERTIAAYLAIRCGTSLVLWKVGYDATYANCSPAALLLERIVARAFEDPHCLELNAITHAAWLDRWNMLQRRYYHVIWYPNDTLALLTGWAQWWLHYRFRNVPALRSAVRGIRQQLSHMRKRVEPFLNKDA